MEKGYFNVTDQEKIGQADVDPAYLAHIILNIEGDDFDFAKPVKYKFTDPVRGELYEPLVVIPPVLISPEEKIKLSKDSNVFDGSLAVTGKKKGFNALLQGVGTEEPDNVKIEYNPDHISFTEENKTIPVHYSVAANIDNEYHFGVDAGNGQKDVYHLGMKEIRYDHIPDIHYFTAATVTNRKLDLKIYNKKIGYIVGAGDKVPEALEQMGYEVTLLTDKELIPEQP